MTPADFNVVALTCWGEARGEGRNGMQAVAEVVFNRANDPKGRWPALAAKVCKQPKQFSCWNRTDPNMPKLAFVTLNDEMFRDAYRSVLDAMAGGSITFGANHYFSARMGPPSWSEDMAETCQIGGHRFFRAE